MYTVIRIKFICHLIYFAKSKKKKKLAPKHHQAIPPLCYFILINSSFSLSVKIAIMYCHGQN